MKRGWLCACAACVLIGAGGLAAAAAAGEGLSAQYAAERWQAGGLPYVQLSVFLAEEAGFDGDAVPALREELDTAMEGLAMGTEDARLWIDAYSTETEADVTAGEKTRQVQAVCTGGDFFFFHETRMLSGWWYFASDPMDGLVVIDEVLAWELFGSWDVVGMEVLVNGWPCVVCGVAAVPETAAEREAYQGPKLYVSYELMERLGMQRPITCYEAVLPEPINGFGRDILSAALGTDGAAYELCQNTDRFCWKNSAFALLKLGERVQRTNKIYYPYWENAARVRETKAAFWMALAGLALLGLLALLGTLCFTKGRGRKSQGDPGEEVRHGQGRYERAQKGLRKGRCRQRF